LILDTTNPKALEAGLVKSKNKTIINGFSLEPAKLEVPTLTISMKNGIFR
jgi:hypothetical protein